MSRQRYQQLRRIFDLACELDATSARRVLDGECGSDASLRAELERLLEGERRSRGFLSVPPPLDELVGDSAREPSVVETPPSLPARYELIRELGRGGMGTVHLVRDHELQREVALKTLRRGGVRAESFRAEARLAARLQHPGIVPVYDLGLSRDGQPYYTMPRVEGRTLEAVLLRLAAGDREESVSYTTTRLVQVLLQVAQAVEHAHACGVVHCDLKPANVMLGHHGEVQVLDWGLGLLLEAASAERPAQRAGTPAYMAPEQTRGGPIGEQTDVYALGVMLYRVLTLELPYEGSPEQILAQHREAEPVAPRARARGREVAVELERVCLRALRKLPAERQASVAELATQLQHWLEAEHERSRRRELADERARAGRDELRRHERLAVELEGIEQGLEAALASDQGWRPADGSHELVAMQDRIASCRFELARSSSQVVTTLTEALGLDGDNRLARETLADYYYGRLVVSERRRQELEATFYHDLTARYHDGKYRRQLAGEGRLSLESEPSGAEVWLWTHRERGFVLEASEPHRLGCTPLVDVPLPMGSYLLILKRQGHRDTRYPVSISRNRDWRGRVRLFSDAEIGDAFVHVPAGPFLGFNSASRGRLRRRTGPDLIEIEVGDVFIGRFPVTMAEYLEFLNQLAAREGVERALAHGPRPASDAPSYLRVSGGRLELPEVDFEGDRWQPDWPVLSVSYYDAQAYIAWRSQRDGRVYRLPSSSEREKAGRGVDGRRYPWGNRFHPSLCNMRESREEREEPAPVGDYPGDVSPYGVRGTAGNSSDWTSTEVVIGRGPRRRVSRVIRGGAWFMEEIDTRCDRTAWSDPHNVQVRVGFRLAADASGC